MTKSDAKVNILQVAYIRGSTNIPVDKKMTYTELFEFESLDLVTRQYVDGVAELIAGDTAEKSQADIVALSDPPYILFTNDEDVQIPDTAVFNIELTGVDGIGVEHIGSVQRIAGERRIYNLPDGNFTLTINYK